MVPDAGTDSQELDRSAQSHLLNAMVAAKTYFTENETYSGFAPDSAAGLDPSLEWRGDTPAAVDIVSINLAMGNEVVMSIQSASGQPFCIADDVASSDPATLGPDGISYGTVDAHGAGRADSCTSSPG